ncbi:hypothetical protein JB92DRAFT_1289359 [Gautieria morchelliformis]|nr:hypothetical protein JB92DRAFT_1289359 [Gautieria morchelliformis]
MERIGAALASPLIIESSRSLIRYDIVKKLEKARSNAPGSMHIYVIAEICLHCHQGASCGLCTCAVFDVGTRHVATWWRVGRLCAWQCGSLCPRALYVMICEKMPRSWETANIVVGWGRARYRMRRSTPHPPPPPRAARLPCAHRLHWCPLVHGAAQHNLRVWGWIAGAGRDDPSDAHRQRYDDEGGILPGRAALTAWTARQSRHTTPRILQRGNRRTPYLQASTLIQKIRPSRPTRFPPCPACSWCTFDSALSAALCRTARGGKAVTRQKVG